MSKASAVARLRGGPAADQEIVVSEVAGRLPRFIGVNGANYVRDVGAHGQPVYNWWPVGASTPAGDPNARSAPR